MSEQPPTLDYRRFERPPSPPTSHFVIGLLSTIVLVIVGVPVAMMLSYSTNTAWPVVLLGVACLGVLVMSAVNWRHPRFRGYAAGACTGLAFAALLEGYCFLVIR